MQSIFHGELLFKNRIREQSRQKMNLRPNLIRTNSQIHLSRILQGQERKQLTRKSTNKIKIVIQSGESTNLHLAQRELHWLHLLDKMNMCQ